MPLSRRSFNFAALLGLGAALTAPAVDAAPERTLVLEEFFSGRTRGEGRFVSDLFGVERRLTVDTVGRVEGQSLILTEYIAYDDGQKETAIWRFDRTGPVTYDGQRTGVQGVVPIRVRDGGVEMSYVGEVKGSDGRPQKLRFADRLEQTNARTVVNTARVSFLGVPVGRVEITFIRR